MELDLSTLTSIILLGFMLSCAALFILSTSVLVWQMLYMVSLMLPKKPSKEKEEDNGI